MQCYIESGCQSHLGQIWTIEHLAPIHVGCHSGHRGGSGGGRGFWRTVGVNQALH